MYPGYDMPPPDARETREQRLEIEEFHADYCWTLDCGDVERWPSTSPTTPFTALPRARTPMPACRWAWCTPIPRR